MFLKKIISLSQSLFYRNLTHSFQFLTYLKNQKLWHQYLYSYTRGRKTDEWLLLYVDGHLLIVQLGSPATVCFTDYLALDGISVYILAHRRHWLKLWNLLVNWLLKVNFRVPSQLNQSFLIKLWQFFFAVYYTTYLNSEIWSLPSMNHSNFTRGYYLHFSRSGRECARTISFRGIKIAHS